MLRTLLYSILTLFGLDLTASNILLISSNYTGRATGNNSSGAQVAISADGRHVAFSSNANDLEGTDTNQWIDVYLVDRMTGTRKCISSPSNFPPHLELPADLPVMSEDGRFVGFRSNNPFLIPAITNYPLVFNRRPLNLFIYDAVSNRYFLGSPNGNAVSPWPGEVSAVTLSANGRYSSFLAGDQLYRGDLEAGTSELVNADLNGSAVFMSNIRAHTPSHRYFIFASGSTNMVAGLPKTNQTSQVYRRDMESDTTRLVSVTTSGDYAETHCFARAISPDGRYVAFNGTSTNLQAGMGGNGNPDLFIRDMESNQTWCVTVHTNGMRSLGTSPSTQVQHFSEDGGGLLFQTRTSPSSFPPFDLHFHEVRSRTNCLLARWIQDVAGLSRDGRYAIFASWQQPLSLMLIDLDTQRQREIAKQGNWWPPFGDIRITADARSVFFTSDFNAAAGITDTNSRPDLFIAPMISPRIERVVGTNTNTVEATAFPGDTVRLQSSGDLRSWTDVESGKASYDGTLRLEHRGATNSVGFYRLVSP